MPGQLAVCLRHCFFLADDRSCGLLFIVFQGHSSNLHHLMPANIQIIRGSAPALQIGTPAVPAQTFASHLPRGMHDVLRTSWQTFPLPKRSFYQSSVAMHSSTSPYCFLCRCCCSSRDVQLQNCPAASHRSKCVPWPAHSAAHHPPDNSGNWVLSSKYMLSLSDAGMAYF